MPVGWWVLATLFALSLLVAVLFYLGPAMGLGAGLLVLAVIGPVFVVYGRLRLRVTEDRLWVGEANVEWRYVADVRALDAVATRRRRGPDADARAFLALRPYLAEAVEVSIGDDADPTPYWLISTRHPARLAAAIRSRLDSVAVRHNPPPAGPDRSDPSAPRDRLQE